jgi:hypothetical protein
MHSLREELSELCEGTVDRPGEAHQATTSEMMFDGLFFLNWFEESPADNMQFLPGRDAFWHGFEG